MCKVHARRKDFNVDNNNDYDDYAHSVSKTRNLRIILQKNLCTRERQELLLRPWAFRELFPQTICIRASTNTKHKLYVGTSTFTSY